MTGRQAAPVRVRVWINDCPMWRCPACEMDEGWPVEQVHDAAHRHAATCTALRLAALTRELETLRDSLKMGAAHNLRQADRYRDGERYQGRPDYPSYLGGLCNASGNAARSIAAILAKVAP